MTTIAACTINGVHAMAADGRCMGGDLVSADRAQKFLAHPYDVVTAHAGSLRTIDIVRLAGPDYDLSTADSFARFLAQVFKEHGYERDEAAGAGPPSYRQEHLHLSPAGIFEIGQELAVVPVTEGWTTAIGSGADFAIGAMDLCLRSREVGPVSSRAVVTQAVSVAMKRDAGTGGSIMVALRGAETFGPEWIDEPTEGRS